MIFSNLHHLNRRYDEIPTYRTRATNSRNTHPTQSTNPATSSSTSGQSPGNRGSLGVTPTQEGLTTAVIIVFALGGFLFVCGIFMLFGGLGEHSQPLVGLGVASVIGGILLSVMGWTLCLKMNRKRRHQEGCVYYSTAGVATDQGLIVEPPPAYSPVQVHPSLPANEQSQPCLVTSSSTSPSQVHSTFLPADSHNGSTMFPSLPPSYNEAVRMADPNC